MRLLGHDISRSVVLVAALDAVLFLILLQGLGMLYTCRVCYIHPLIHLGPVQALLLTSVFLVITSSVGLYNTDALQSVGTFFKRLLLAWQFVFVPAVVMLAVSHAAVGMAFGWYVGIISLAITLFMAVLLIVRLALMAGLGLGFLKRRLIVVGDGQMAQAVVNFVRGPGRSEFDCLDVVCDWREPHGPTRLGNLKLKAPLPERAPLMAVAEALHANQIVVAVEETAGLPVEELLECRLKGIQVVDTLTFWEREARLIDPTQAESGWLTFSDGFALDPSHRFVKRVVDIMISVVFLVLIAPVCLFTALAIKLEDRHGPVLYLQERVGLNGRIFKLWKFRSMRADAERDGVPLWASKTDDRVTRVGRFIRKVRIDEIPQVINVLAGHMSFIGPRPERPFFVEQLKQQVPHYDLRHRVRPGITGWAQVNYPYGASVEDAKRKLSYDLYYLKKNDLLLDLAILVQTVRVILFAHGSR